MVLAIAVLTFFYVTSLLGNKELKAGCACTKWPKINDIFMIIEQSDICNFVGDNTLYSCGEWLTEIKKKLIFDTKGISNWFRLNSLNANLENTYIENKFS